MKDNITHRLSEKESDKLLNLELKDTTLITESGKLGKLKITEKTFSTKEEALKNFYKKEWESLKKGLVLNNESLKAGEATLHKFIGGFYTGCLSFENTPKGIYVYKSNGDDLSDSLIVIDKLGTVLEEVKLPRILPWNIEYRENKNSLLMDLDHFITEFKIDNDLFTDIGTNNKHFSSFISVTKSKSAFASDGELKLIDNDNKVLHSSEYTTEIINGVTPFCGKLSTDGLLLAFHNKEGEIQIYDTDKWQLITKIIANFKMVQNMSFSNDNSTLIIQEQYGNWKMRYFDLLENKELKFENLEIPGYTKEVSTFCFNSDQSKLVLIQNTTAFVYDFMTKQLLYSFKIEHLVRKCKIKFIDDKLGIRTDYGCFSLYNI